MDVWLYFQIDILYNNHCDEYEQRNFLHFYKYLLVWKDVGGHDTLLEHKKLNKTFVWVNFNGNYSWCMNITSKERGIGITKYEKYILFLKTT